MPDRAYHPEQYPPTRWDHALAHPGQVTFSIWWILCGLLITTSGFVDFEPTVTIAALSLPRTLGLGLSILVGGALVLWGSLTQHSRLRQVWGALRAGLIISAGAWAGYTAATFALDRLAATTWTLGIANIAFCALAFIATVREERRARRVTYRAGLTG